MCGDANVSKHARMYTKQLNSHWFLLQLQQMFMCLFFNAFVDLRERKGEGERNNYQPAEPSTGACALTGNWAGDRLVPRMTLNSCYCAQAPSTSHPALI